MAAGGERLVVAARMGNVCTLQMKTFLILSLFLPKDIDKARKDVDKRGEFHIRRWNFRKYTNQTWP